MIKITPIAAGGALPHYNQNFQQRTPKFYNNQVSKQKVKDDFKLKLDKEISKLSIDILI